MEEYRYTDETAEDEAILAAEENADQEDIMGLDDDLDMVPADDERIEESAEESEEMLAETEEDSALSAEEENTEVPAAADGQTEGEGKKRPQMVTVVGVRFRTAGKAYYFSPGPYEVRRSSHVIVETARGVEYGTVVSIPMEIERRKLRSPLKEILRPATEEDDARHLENRKKEREAYRVCFKKIREHRLEMKLIDAEYTFDNNKILFYFTADGRIDFRDLVKDLAGIFKTRIELRQIGVRDETKILGGYGSCGRPLCCHTYLSDFVPVSIKMAKEQNLSLNPTKISGVCGRLMCCLKNEEETYEELNRNLPRPGDEVEGPDGLQGEVASVNVLRQKVRILVEIDDEKEIHEYAADEITMIRRRKRGEAKHRAKRIENGQERPDELRQGERKGRPARGDGGRQVRTADGERPAREENAERPARHNDGERSEGNRGQQNGDNAREERRERRRSDRRPGQGRRGGREGREGGENAGTREGRENTAGRGSREQNAGAGQNAERTDGNRERGHRENQQNAGDHEGGRRDHRRRGRGRGERREGQQSADNRNTNESRGGAPSAGGEN